jgi:class 3 adenylate cyclase
VPVGVHTGECDLSTAALTGPAVDLAASVARHARPGRVVVSSTVRDLVAGSGLSFVARPIAGDGDAEGSPSIFEVDSAHLASAVVNV